MNVREKLRKIENKAEKFKKGNKYKSRKNFFFKVCAWKKKKFCCVFGWVNTSQMVIHFHGTTIGTNKKPHSNAVLHQTFW